MFNDSMFLEVKEKIKKCKEKLNVSNTQLQFFDDFYSSINSSSICENVKNINIVDFVIAYITVYSDKYDFDDIFEKVNDNRTFIDDDVDLKETIVDILVKIINSDNFDIAYDIISNNEIADSIETQDSTSVRKTDLDGKLAGVDDKIVADIYFLDSMGYVVYGKSFKDVLKFFNDDLDFALNIVEHIDGIKRFKSELEFITDFKDFVEENGDTLKIQNKENGKVHDFDVLFTGDVNPFLTDDGKVFKKTLKSFIEYYDSLRREDKLKRKTIRTDINGYTAIQNLIGKNLNNIEVYNLPKEILKISNEEDKLKILKYIYEENMKVYKSKYKIYNSLIENSYSKYVSIFEKYGLDINKFKINEEISPETLDSFVAKFMSLNIENKDNIIYILNNANIENIETIFSYLSKGLITGDFIANNLEIFLDKFDNFNANIKLFINNGIPFSSIVNSCNILNNNHTIIKNNFEVLKEYDLVKYLKKSSNSSFLISEDLSSKIDIILEQGFEDNLKNDLKILNYSINDYKKIIILKRLNMEVDNSSLDGILATNYNIDFSLIDDYIFNKTMYIGTIDGKNINKEEFLSNLGEYDYTSRTYNINGVLISKNKIKKELKNYSDDEFITPSEEIRIVTKDSILDNNEYNSILKLVNPDSKILIKK